MYGEEVLELHLLLFSVLDTDESWLDLFILVNDSRVSVLEVECAPGPVWIYSRERSLTPSGEGVGANTHTTVIDVIV
jgi:hypothetical protein